MMTTAELMRRYPPSGQKYREGDIPLIALHRANTITRAEQAAYELERKREWAAQVAAERAAMEAAPWQ